MADFMELDGIRYELDHKGYLIDMFQWNPKIRDWLATQEKITLSPDHLKVVEYLHIYFEKHDDHPGGRMMTKAFAEIFGEEKGRAKYFSELFPGGFNQAYKIAGLPMRHTCC